MMKKTSINDDKRGFYEQVIQRHLEKGPVEHDYTFGFLSELLEDALDLMDGSSRVEYISPAINICGDIRSRYGDLLDAFRTCGWPFEQKYLFLGNVISGGKFTLEVLVLLLSSKICYPENVVMLRGYFEDELVRSDRSFIGELRVKFPDANKWQSLNSSIKALLGRLPLVAILNRKLICVNGMVSSNIKDEKNVVIVKNGAAFESHNTRLEVQFPDIDAPASITPNKIEEDSKEMRELLKSVEMSLIINSNNVIKHGYQFSLGHQLLTITCGTKMIKTTNNRGVVMMMDRHNKVTFKRIHGLDADERADLADWVLR
ncbi:unnamed protein product [Caenorhabditis sp. 36 PRJEB53466]|nr:unnamed protein product [Caenorhabditis sp. 36 PRJEB53466]